VTDSIPELCYTKLTADNVSTTHDYGIFAVAKERKQEAKLSLG